MTWETGISTGIGYRRPITEALQPIRQAGFRLLEVSTAPQHLDLRRLERIPALRRDMEALGLEARALHAPFGPHVDLTSPDAEMRRRSLDQMARAADALQMLGGRIFVIHPGSEDHAWTWEREPRLARSVEGLTAVLEICRERGLLMTVETPLPHLLGGRLSDLEWILARLPSGIGVCLDTSHTSLGRFLFEAIERLGARLTYVQASDNRGVTDDHSPPGDGILEWDRILGALEDVGYQGPIVLELTGGEDVALTVAHAAETVRARCPRLLAGAQRSAVTNSVPG